MSALVYRGRLK